MQDDVENSEGLKYNHETQFEKTIYVLTKRTRRRMRITVRMTPMVFSLWSVQLSLKKIVEILKSRLRFYLSVRRCLKLRSFVDYA